MSVIALIPARGGSKGLPGKNIRPLGGKPLLGWSVDAARGCPEIDRIIVSTDDEEIAGVARAQGAEVPFLRPPELARDDTPTLDVILHLLNVLPVEPELVVLLQPTSPLRTSADISQCIRICREQGVDSCIGITAATESPYWMFWRGEKGVLRPLLGDTQRLTRRQDLPPAYLINGAVYVARSSELRRYRSLVGPAARGYEMPPERSIDIDTLADFEFAEQLLAGRRA